MTKKYADGMNFLLYEFTDVLDPKNPTSVLTAQFKKKDDALLFVKAKWKTDDSLKFELLDNLTHESVTLVCNLKRKNSY